MPKRRIGKEVRVEFWDHVEDSKERELLKCRVYGLIVDEKPESYTIATWDLDDDDQDVLDNNRKQYTIHKGTIIKLEEIVEYKKLRVTKPKKK